MCDSSQVCRLVPMWLGSGWRPPWAADALDCLFLAHAVGRGEPGSPYLFFFFFLFFYLFIFF